VGGLFVLGHSHSTSGALAWAAAAAWVPVSVWPSHLALKDVVLGTFVTAGAALLPDLDHPDGTIAHFLGPVSHAFCRFVEWISGGHRHATHSFFFVALTTAGTWAGAHYLKRPFTLALVYILLSLAIRALHLCPPGKGIQSWGVVMLLAVAGTGAMALWIGTDPFWLPIAVGLGTLTHLAGDCVTKEGCPLFWPIPARLGIPLIRHTGEKLETAVLTPLMAIGAVVALYYASIPLSHVK
jgi:membrane-bound metal-dependent hydrolase YbcI (DUF457 family)